MRLEGVRRLVAWTALSVLFGVVLTGCGGGSETSSDGDSASVGAAVDLTGVSVEMHQAPG
jgi:hypothetical protein